MPADGLYEVKSLDTHHHVNILGVPHYIGHPYTKRIVERLGAVESIHSAFKGLKIGESALCVPINHNKENRRQHKFTRANQKVSIGDLKFRILTRLK